MHKKVLYFQTKFLAEKKEGAITISGFGSTGDLDRYNDKVLPTAFSDSLPTFMKNPVMLLQHDDNKVIGKFTSTEIKGNGLQVTGDVMYDIDGCMKKIEDGVLGAFSIGFITQAYQYEDADGHILYKSDEGLMAGYSWEDLDEEKTVRVITKLDLVEISVVSTPANPYALFQVAKDFFIEETKALKSLATQKKGAPNEVEEKDGVGQEEPQEAIETKTEEVTTETPPETKEEVTPPEVNPNTTEEEAKSVETTETQEVTPSTASEEEKSEDVKAVEEPTETPENGVTEEQVKALITESVNLAIKEISQAFEIKLSSIVKENEELKSALSDQEKKYAKLENEVLSIETVRPSSKSAVKSMNAPVITDEMILKSIGFRK